MPVGVLNLGEKNGRRHEIHKNEIDHERNSTPNQNENSQSYETYSHKIIQTESDKE